MKNINIISGILLIVSLSIVSCKKDKKDATSPVITVLDDNPKVVGKGTSYSDPGATALDETDGDISSSIIVTNLVSTADTGWYQVKYNVSDKAGNAAEEAIRRVQVVITK